MRSKSKNDESKRSNSSHSNRFKSVKVIKPADVETVTSNIQKTQIEKKISKITNAEKRLEAELRRITEQVNDKLSYSNIRSSKGETNNKLELFNCK